MRLHHFSSDAGTAKRSFPVSFSATNKERTLQFHLRTRTAFSDCFWRRRRGKQRKTDGTEFARSQARESRSRANLFSDWEDEKKRASVYENKGSVELSRIRFQRCQRTDVSRYPASDVFPLNEFCSFEILRHRSEDSTSRKRRQRLAV